MTRRSWLAVGLLSGTAMASYLARVNLSVVGDPIMGEYGLSQVQIGRVFSAFLLGYALCQIPGGWLADRWGTRRVLTVASASWVIVTVGMAAAGWGPLAAIGVIPTLLVLRFALGVGEAPMFPGAARGVSRWVPPSRQGTANGMVLAAIGLGSALAPPLLTFTMIRWGWRAALLVSVIPAAAATLIWAVMREPKAVNRPEPDRSSEPASPASRLKSRSFVLLTASYTLQGYVGYIFVFWFYLYLVQERGFTLLEGAFLSSLPWILSIVSIPFGGWLSDRLVRGRAGLVWGRRIVPLVGMVTAGVLLALGAATLNPYLAAVYLAGSTAAVLSVEGPFWATMMSIGRDRSGTAGGIMNMGSNVGGLISPALTPVLAVSIGWENALHIAAALAVLAGLLWMGVRAQSA
jgi:ACS family glucarate transporter-like MFS transporter